MEKGRFGTAGVEYGGLVHAGQNGAAVKNQGRI